MSKDKSSSLASNIYYLPFIISCLVVLAIRSIYVFKQPNFAGDTPVYLSIANCINNGFGFSYPVAGTQHCEPVVGGYFPLYPYILAFLDNIFHNLKLTAISFSIFNSLSIFVLGFVSYAILKKRIFSVLVVVLLGFSPLGLGFSRYLLIEPVLISFGILILSATLSRQYRLIGRTRFFVTAFILFVISIYLKPTAVIFSLPILITLTKGLKLKSAVIHCLLFVFLCVLAILPWCLRNMQLNPELGFISVRSTLYPENIMIYYKWTTTWIITEYERANAQFPLWTDSSLINIRPNIFLSSFSADQAMDILQAPNSPIRGLSTEQSNYFFGEYKKTQESLNFFKYVLLKTLQTVSLFLHLKFLGISF